ncbi:hypothetical protein [Prevotella sp. TCVGH]|uniref:hypothetical protein n=1 Tax=Prevotella sp. TCVGH TaxID=2182433 RepID=UPI00201DF210|nr:hypothetical protein [Prevotella sp. TCVGH]
MKQPSTAPATVTSNDVAKSYKITLRNVAHQLTFQAKAGRSPKRNIAHGNTMGKR